MEFEKTAQIVLPIPVNQTFTYWIPQSFMHECQQGSRVLISFHGKEKIGIIWSINQTSWFGNSETLQDNEPQNIKSILKVLQPNPGFSKEQLHLVEKIYELYHYPLGSILQLMFPGYKEFSKKKINIQTSKKKLLSKVVQLNKQQQEIFEVIDQKFQQVQCKRDFFNNEYLIHGITGSGKTEIYISLIKKALEKDYSTIYIVPEISLATHLQSRLEEYFGNQLIIFHSQLSKLQKIKNLQRLYQEKGLVVLGTRSAIYLPVLNLMYIILDEEHDNSYKEKYFPPLDARKIAKIRRKIENCILIMGSATPRIETVYESKKQTTDKYTCYFPLMQRYGKAMLPMVEIVSYQSAQERNHGISARILDILSQNIKRRKKNLLLFNRRGFYRSVYNCAHKTTRMCPNCSVSLVLHKFDFLKCHYCNYIEKFQKQNEDIFSGRGIQHTEKFLLSFFPGLRIARIDTDEISSYKKLQHIFEEFANGEIDIMLGTQMIAKGLDFSELDFVGVLEADAGLYFPDFRARERTFALLVQVAGRAGRSLNRGRVIFECLDPTNNTIKLAAHHNYEAFYDSELKQRKHYHYPPFTRLIKIVYSGNNQENVKKICQSHSQYLEKIFAPQTTKLLGTSEAPLNKIKKEFRWQTIINTREFSKAFKNVSQIVAKNDTAVKILIDPDPIDFI